MKLTLNEFKKDYSGIDTDLIELAEAAMLVDDSCDLYIAAKEYLVGLDRFKHVLKTHKIYVK